MGQVGRWAIGMSLISGVRPFRTVIRGAPGGASLPAVCRSGALVGRRM